MRSLEGGGLDLPQHQCQQLARLGLRMDRGGKIIGPAGSTIKRLIQGTGCKIEVPRRERGEADDGIVKVQLTGGPVQRKLALDAILDVVKGGEAEDHAARATGGLVLPHNFERVADEETGEKAPDFDRISWLVWRLIAVEFDHGVKVESGRRTIRVYAKPGKPPLTGDAAEKVRSEVAAIIDQARSMIKLTVETQLDKDPENANYDQAVLTLTDQYGVLLRVPRPEGGCCPIEVLGPEEPARDAAELLEAKYAKGKATACVLQVPDQVQSLDDAVKEDFAADLQALEEEQRVKIRLATSCIWLSGNSPDTVEAARQTIVEMLQFYLPEGFLVMKGLKKSAVDKIREDEELRSLRVKPDCAFSLHPAEGIAWICGASLREKVQARIEAILAKWALEHFELDLGDFGEAMWLLGPRGSGEWLGRMQSESGAKIQVNPNELKVYIDGPPAKLQAGKQQVLKGLDQLRAKQAAEDAAGGRAATKAK
ncbi:unnamed protein product, partial [Prorocentrum cordatum]